MDIQDLAQVAADRVNIGCEILQLVMPHKRYEPTHMHLSGRKSPRGRVAPGSGNGSTVKVNFKALDVLIYCLVHGATGKLVTENGRVIIDTTDDFRKGEGDGKPDF